jgi:HAD superfamily hydrolase (TIGR01484 family)
MKKVVLFDMDGTLTAARKKMKWSVLSALKKLQDLDIEIGIVTGSSMEYIKEQCVIMFDDFNFDHTRVHYFPCNGTKYVRYNSNTEDVVYHMSMEDQIGKEKYREVLYCLIENQSRIKLKLYSKDIPLTGNFIDCRGSMINWCPIGRNANHEDRSIWKLLDTKYKIRESLLDSCFRSPLYENITVKLGGSTSFDIYPSGWDKSLVLRKFNQEDNIWFVGDSCRHHGNDKEIYEAVKAKDDSKSFETKSPAQTINIINTIISLKGQ